MAPDNQWLEQYYEDLRVTRDLALVEKMTKNNIQLSVRSVWWYCKRTDRNFSLITTIIKHRQWSPIFVPLFTMSVKNLLRVLLLTCIFEFLRFFFVWFFGHQKIKFANIPCCCCLDVIKKTPLIFSVLAFGLCDNTLQCCA